MMKQILGAVEACHVKHCVTHRDLKPENFLLVNKNDISQIRMIDFGLSRFFAQVTLPFYEQNTGVVISHSIKWPKLTQSDSLLLLSLY